MKRPSFLDTCPTAVCHPSATLILVARALEFDASLLAHDGQKAEAINARYYARALRAVAKGATWADALGLPKT